MNSQSSAVITNDEKKPSLFEKEDVRVSDLVGNLSVQENKYSAPAPAVRHDGPLRLDWYDWSIVVLVVASLVAGIVCLLSSV